MNGAPGASSAKLLSMMRSRTDSRIARSGELGELLHIEANFSNEVSANLFSPWRDSPAESPAGGMTGTGIHALDAMIRVAGPVRRVQAQLLSHRPAPDPRDTISAIFEFRSGISGMLAAVRCTPMFWRVHAFGRDGSAEAYIAVVEGEGFKMGAPEENVLRRDALAAARRLRDRFLKVAALRCDDGLVALESAAMSRSLQAFSSPEPSILGNAPGASAGASQVSFNDPIFPPVAGDDPEVASPVRP